MKTPAHVHTVHITEKQRALLFDLAHKRVGALIERNGAEMSEEDLAESEELLDFGNTCIEARTRFDRRARVSTSRAARPR